MKILHLVHQYLPRWVGGVEIYTQSLARALNQQGHTVAVFVPENEPGGLQVFTDEGVKVYRWRRGSLSEARQWLATLGEAATLSAFERVLNDFRPDVVHIQHLLGLPASLVTILTARRIPSVMTLHDYGLLCANTKLLTNGTEQSCRGPQAYINCAQCGLAKAGQRHLGLFAPTLAPIFALRARSLHAAVQSIQHFIAPTEFVRDLHINLGGIPARAIRVLDYGIDLPDTSRVPLRTEGALRVAFIGSIARLKGVHVLLSAFNQLPSEAELHIAGDLTRQPQYVGELRQLVHHPGIHFLGPLNRVHAQALMDWADIVAVPSIWYEVSPLVIHEAWARGRPVIVGAIGSLASLVKHESNGLHIQPHQPSAWAEALLRLHHNRAKLKALQAQVSEPKSIKQHVTELEEIYPSLFT